MLPLLDPVPIVIQMSKLLLVDYHRHPNIEVIVSRLITKGHPLVYSKSKNLPWDIHWSIRRVKIKKINAYLNDSFGKSTKISVMYQDPDWTLPDNSLNMQLYYQDHLHLIENGNIKFSRSIIKILYNVLSPQSSSRLSQSAFSR